MLYLHKRTSPFCCVPAAAPTWTTLRAWTDMSHPVNQNTNPLPISFNLHRNAAEVARRREQERRQPGT